MQTNKQVLCLVYYSLYHGLATFTEVIFVNVHHAQMSTFVMEVCLWYIGFVTLSTIKINRKCRLWYNVSVPYPKPDPRSTLLSVLSSAWFGVWDTDTLYTVHFTLYTVYCTLYTVHCTLYTVHCTLYTVHCILACSTVPQGRPVYPGLSCWGQC